MNFENTQRRYVDIIFDILYVLLFIFKEKKLNKWCDPRVKPSHKP